MPRVLLSASFDPELILRQTPGGSGCWEEYQFLTEASLQKESTVAHRRSIDAWTVYDDIPRPMECTCPWSNTLFITGEPESLRRYRRRFTSQFAKIWTSHSTIQHPDTVRRHEGQHWHYGLYAGGIHGSQLSFEQLRQLPRPAKTKSLSVICSAKTSTEDHRARLEFVQLLQRALGQDIDVFGRGINEIRDKADAIYDYRYHIVLENDHSDYFMTEKLCDAFLGWSYPIYFGGTEAHHCFPEGSFTAIDIRQPEVALNIIRNVLLNETYQRQADAIAEARRRVLFEHNICAMLASYWREHLTQGVAVPVQLLPKKHRAGLVLNQFRRAVWKQRRANRHSPKRAA